MCPNLRNLVVDELKHLMVHFAEMEISARRSDATTQRIDS